MLYEVITFATSEQVPSSVALGVLMNRNNTVRQAGGFILQMMPFADDSLVTALEDKLTKVTSVTQMLDEGMTPEQILTFLVITSYSIHYTKLYDDCCCDPSGAWNRARMY